MNVSTTYTTTYKGKFRLPLGSFEPVEIYYKAIVPKGQTTPRTVYFNGPVTSTKFALDENGKPISGLIYKHDKVFNDKVAGKVAIDGESIVTEIATCNPRRDDLDEYIPLIIRPNIQWIEIVMEKIKD